MIDVTRFRHKTVAVFGLGKTGLSVVRSLLMGRCRVLAWDDNPANRGNLEQLQTPELLALGIPETIADPATYNWAQVAALILSPGVPLTHPSPHPIVTMARKAGCPIICDIELLTLTCPQASYIAITGTNGKSTTTSLTAHLLKSSGVRTQVGGNLGIPVLDLEPLASDGVYVLETSSYQLDLLEDSHFNTSILLNITPDHLDRHGDMQGYVTAKKRIFRNQNAKDAAIIGIDTEESQAVYEQLQASNTTGLVIPISTKTQVKGGVSVIDGVLYNDLPTLKRNAPEVLPLGELPRLSGQHNGENIAASFAACALRGISSSVLLQAIKSFQGLPHRLQYLGEIAGVRFYNDSKGTNAEATEKALRSFDKNIYWILGGQAKEGGITSLAPLFTRIRHAFLIGEAADAFAETLTGKVPYTKCGTLERAFEAASETASRECLEGAVVLLSPACASWDQWANFEKRGEAFCAMVAAFQNNHAPVQA